MTLMVSMPAISARVVRATAVAVLFVLSSCARGGDSPVDVSATRRAIVAADSTWAAAATAGDLEGGVASMANDGVMFPPNQAPVVGRAAIREYMRQAFAIPGFSISWSTDTVVVSSSGDQAYSVGRSRYTFPARAGSGVDTTYAKGVTVWRRDQDGRWRVAVDIWNGAPAPAPVHTSSLAPRMSPPVVTVVAHDYAFSTPAPSSVPAGPVTFRMINAGKELHMMGVVWLGAHSFRDFVAAVQGDSTFPGAYGAGGPDAVMPGDTSYATVILEPGHVALACWVEGEDGKMHVMKGMMTALDVSPAGAHPAEMGKADLALTLRDYAIEMSGAPAPGHRAFRVENRGPGVHDVELFRMAPGATMADIDAWLHHPGKGSSKARPLGGMVGIEHGHHGWFSVNLTPGDYVLVCWIPGEKGVPHYAGHGMLKRFHVASSAASDAVGAL